MYLNTLVYPIQYKIDWSLASIFLDQRQKFYTHRLLNFPDLHLTKHILTLGLGEKGKKFQPRELP